MKPLLLLLATTLIAHADLLDWTSTKGTTIKAELITATAETVVLKTEAGKEITLKRDQLDEASQAQIDAAGGDDDDEDDPNNPEITYNVPKFTSGPWKGSHAVYECEKFIAVADERAVVKIFQKKDGARVSGTVPCYIRPAMLYYPAGETQIRKLTRVESKGDPQMQPKKLRFTGEAQSGTEFEYFYEFEEDRVICYGTIKDPRDIEEPTRLHFTVHYPGYNEITSETTGEARKKIVGESMIELKTAGGEKLDIDYLEPQNLNQIEAVKEGLSESRVLSVKCGPRVIKVTAPDSQYGTMRVFNAGVRGPYLGFGVSLNRKDFSDKSDKACLTLTLE